MADKKVGKNEIIHGNFIYRVLDNAVSNSAISFRTYDPIPKYDFRYVITYVKNLL